MEVLLDALVANKVILYFVYGQTFFVMGIVIALHSRSHSRLPLARHLKWLAAFGVVHGLVEWSHIFIPIQSTYVSGETVLLLNDVHTVMLALSFYLLFQFGMLISFQPSGRRWLFYSVAIGVPLVFIAVEPALHVIEAQTGLVVGLLIPKTELSARVVLGFTGAAIASFGMYRQARLLRQTGWLGIARCFRWTAICMAMYALVAGLVVPLSVGTTLELAGFLFMTDIPIIPAPLFRSIAGIGIAYGVIRGLGIFEMETERMLQEAEHDRLRAAERARLSLDAIAAALSRRVPKGTLLDIALERVLGIMEGSTGWVMVVRAGDAALETWASRGLDKPIPPETPCPGADGCSCRRIVSGADPFGIFSASHCRLLAEAENHSAFVSVPLKAQDRVVGILNIASEKHGPEEIGLLASMGKQIGLALENAELWEALHHKEEVRARLLGHVIAAQEDERKRVARELHDETGQKLSAVIMGLGAADDALSRGVPQGKQIVRDTREVAVEALEGIRQLILGLRPSVLDDFGLAPGLRRIAEELSRLCSMEIRVTSDGLDGSLPPEAEIVLFRILQEGMNNAVRHSRGRRVMVHVGRNGSEVNALVEDDGKGFDLAMVAAHTENGRGLGLIGMQERASLLGGEVNVHSAPGTGTRLHVRLPLPNEVLQ